jgi:hypothetical protein
MRGEARSGVKLASNWQCRLKFFSTSVTSSVDKGKKRKKYWQKYSNGAQLGR